MIVIDREHDGQTLNFPKSLLPADAGESDVLERGRAVSVKRGFRTSEVAKLAGLTQRQLDYWDRTGFLKPSLARAAGRGSARFYSFRDVVELRIAKELRDAGIPLQALRRVVEYLRDVEGLEICMRGHNSLETAAVLTARLVEEAGRGRAVVDVPGRVVR